MQKEQQLCMIQGHEDCLLTYICIFRACDQISRYMCEKCFNKYKHDHDYQRIYHLQIEKFIQYFQDQRLPQIELRNKSLNGNIAKLNYLTKINQEGLDLNGPEFIRIIFIRINELIQGYKNEIVQVQLLNDIYYQLTLHGLEGLNFELLNILLNTDWEFYNIEIKNYAEINTLLLYFDEENEKLLKEVKNEYDKDNIYYQYIQKQIEQFTQIQQLSIKLRRINNYLDFQQHSIDGNNFTIHQEYFDNSSLFSQNHRYFAMINYFKQQEYNKLNIRNQKTLKIINELKFNRRIMKVKFDSLFNYCLIYDKERNFQLYILKNKKQFKLIQKFSLKNQYEYAKDFFISNQRSIIIILNKSFIIKPLYKKKWNTNKDSNEFCFRSNSFSDKFYNNVCYGSERNVIAVQDEKQLRIYQETENQINGFIFSDHFSRFSAMKFTNNDQELLILNGICMQLLQIDYYNKIITELNQIRLFGNLNIDSINLSGFIIVQLPFRSIRCDGIEFGTLDKNFNLYYNFKIPDLLRTKIQCQSIQMTKHMIVLHCPCEGCQVIKRRLITDYQSLDNDY